MREINLIVGNTPIGEALTYAFRRGQNEAKQIEKIFIIPTYHLLVKGTDKGGKKVEEKFEVMRFGIQKETKKSSPRVVGLADEQSHIIKAWYPSYELHSANSPENGAWVVYGNFLIHDGPDNPLSAEAEIYAVIGCLAICGPKGFEKFNKLLLRLGGAPGKDTDSQLKAIGESKKLKITYKKATRPPLKEFFNLDSGASLPTSPTQFFESVNQTNNQDEVMEIVTTTLEDHFDSNVLTFLPKRWSRKWLKFKNFTSFLHKDGFLQFSSSILGSYTLNGWIISEEYRLKILLVFIPNSKDHKPGDLPGKVGKLLEPFNFLSIPQYGIILSNHYLFAKDLLNFGAYADNDVIIEPGLNITLLTRFSDSSGVLGDAMEVLEEIIGKETHLLLWNLSNQTAAISLDIQVTKDIQLSIDGIHLFGLIEPELSLHAAPASVEISGLIHIDFPLLELAVPGSILFAQNSISGIFSAQELIDDFPPPFGFPGIHLSQLQISLQAQFNPSSFNVGASGTFYIGPNKPAELPVDTPIVSAGEIPGNNEFSLIFSTQTGTTTPVLLSMFLSELSLETFIIAVTNQDFRLPKFLQFISFHQTMLYWCGSPTPLVQADGSLAYPGLGLSGIIQILGVHTYSKLEVSSDNAISGELIFDPIRIGGNLLEITGEGEGTPAGYQGAVTVSPGGALMRFDTKNSPYFTFSGNLSVLGIAEAGLDGKIGEDGITFELRQGIGGVFKQSLQVSYKNITEFAASAQLDIQLTNISISLPFDLGKISLDTHVSGSYAASFVNDTFKSSISAQFSWNGNTFSLGTINIQISDVRKLPEYLAEYIIKHVAEIFKDILKNVLAWLEAVLDKAIELIGDVLEKVGNTLANYFKETLEASAKLMKKAGYIALDTGRALIAGFNKSAEEIASAMKQAGYLVEEVGEVLKQLFEISEQSIAEILNLIGYSVAEIANVLKVVLGKSIQEIANILKGIGKTAEEVGRALKLIGEPVEIVSNVLKSTFNLADDAVKNILKIAGYPINIVDDLIPHLKHIKAPHIKHIKAPHIKHIKAPHIKHIKLPHVKIL